MENPSVVSMRRRAAIVGAVAAATAVVSLTGATKVDPLDRAASCTDACAGLPPPPKVATLALRPPSASAGPTEGLRAEIKTLVTPVGASPGSDGAQGGQNRVNLRVLSGLDAPIRAASILIMDPHGRPCGRGVTDVEGRGTVAAASGGPVLLIVSPPPPWIGEARWAELPSDAATTWHLARGRTRSGRITGPDGLGAVGYEVRARIRLSGLEGTKMPTAQNPIALDAQGSILDGATLVRRTRADAEGWFAMEGVPDSVDSIEISGFCETIVAAAAPDWPVFVRVTEASQIAR